MGEAKRRGTREQRVQRAIEKAEEKRHVAQLEQQRRKAQLASSMHRRGKSRLPGLALASAMATAASVLGEGGQG